MWKRVLVGITIVLICLVIVVCQKRLPITSEYFSKFNVVRDTSLSSYKLCRVEAVREVQRLGLDTTSLDLTPYEDSVSYLFSYGPRKPLNPFGPNGTITVIAGGGTDILISKANCKIQKVYISK
jgi:hypothetical protein